jgi:hypothetical protein
MNVRKWKTSIFSIIIGIILSGCGSRTSIQPAITLTPTKTQVPTKITYILSGKINYSGERNDVIVTKIILSSGKDNISKATDNDGNYSYSNLDTGDYSLWIQLTTSAKMISSCTDVIYPDNKWSTGFMLEGGPSLTVGIYSLYQAIKFIPSIESMGWTAPSGINNVIEIYAISPSIHYIQGTTKTFDITFNCATSILVQSPTATVTKEQCQTIIYIVKEGDTLVGITLEYGINIQDIRDYNPEIIGDEITPGMKLTIPLCRHNK